MSAGTYDILIEKGATFQLSLTWKAPTNTPYDLTGYTARMQVRKSVNATAPLLSLTSSGGDIVLGGAAGTIVITASATATAAMDATHGVYDLELVAPSGTVTRVLKGSVEISPEVTR